MPAYLHKKKATKAQQAKSKKKTEVKKKPNGQGKKGTTKTAYKKK